MLPPFCPPKFCVPEKTSIGVFPTIFEALCKHDLLMYLEEWRRTAIFPTYSIWKSLVKERIILYEENRSYFMRKTGKQPKSHQNRNLSAFS